MTTIDRTPANPSPSNPDPDSATRDLTPGRTAGTRIGRLRRAGGCGLLLSLVMVAGCEGPPMQPPTIAPTQPLAVDTPPPAYPPELACADVGGTVELIMKIGADGSPTDIRVENSSGQPALDQSAMEAVETWKFRPATRNGNPVSTDLRVPVTFDPPTMRPDMCFQLDEQR